ncbi:MFS transporter [Spirochaeta lutea]|uniref:Major facilitator superfamily (MFS) profile domain-containing protein n=1 Tax=Spirochaeta lutea TaxID=1480694 RepID=A0A098R5D7_9SPIO|nr:MFS transporter [Spirochaeta lutea]KGE73957.1 hypothetical protein DC28_01935 [Spirochaeta lutea]
MQKPIKKILNLIMFFQLFTAGAFNPIQSLYFTQHLGFSGTQTGLILSFAVVSAILAPLLSSLVVDRILSARRLLMVLHGVSAGAGVFFSFQDNFILVLLSYFIFMITQGPTVGLVNAVTFANLPEPTKSFGGVRMFGTLGWMVAGWSFGLVGHLLSVLGGDASGTSVLLPWAFRIAALGSLLTLLFAAILPGKPKPVSVPRSLKDMIPREALAVLGRPEILLLMMVYFVSGISDRFYVFGAGPYLSMIGFSQAQISPILTIGQIAEVPALFFLGRLLKRFGFRTVFSIGLIAQVARFAIFGYGTHPVLVFFAVGLNSLVFGFFYAGATVFIDSHTDIESRSSVHQLINLVFMGLGSLVGNTLAGVVSDLIPGTQKFGSTFWTVPFWGSVILLTLTWVLVFPRIFRKPLQSSS